MRKLIRDKLDMVIPENELEFVKDEHEHLIMLLAKLDEELAELAFEDFKDVTEYADVIEVLFALAKKHGIDENTIMSTRIEKKYEKGAFERGLILNR